MLQVPGFPDAALNVQDRMYLFESTKDIFVF